MMRFTFAHILVALLPGLILPAALQAQQRSIPFERITTDSGLSSNTINTMLHDRQGFMWFATPLGLNRYDDYRFTTYTNEPLDSTSLTYNWVRTIYEDRAGIIWVGTRGGGLDRLDPTTGVFSHYRHEQGNPHSLSHDNVMALLEDRTGALWVGTEFGGLSKMDRFELDSTSSTPRDMPVYQIHEYGEGVFFVGAGYGLVQLDVTTRRFRFYESTVASDRDQAVFAIHEDRAGLLWIGSTYGLEHFDPATGRLTPIPLGETASNTAYVVASIHEDPSGVLWVGTEDGGL